MDNTGSLIARLQPVRAPPRRAPTRDDDWGVSASSSPWQSYYADPTETWKSPYKECRRYDEKDTYQWVTENIIDVTHPSKLKPHLELPCTFRKLPPNPSLFSERALIARQPCRHCQSLNARRPKGTEPIPCVISTNYPRCLLCILTALGEDRCCALIQNERYLREQDLDKTLERNNNNHLTPESDRLEARRSGNRELFSGLTQIEIRKTSTSPTSSDLVAPSLRSVSSGGKTVATPESIAAEESTRKRSLGPAERTASAKGSPTFLSKRARNEGVSAVEKTQQIESRGEDCRAAKTSKPESRDKAHPEATVEVRYPQPPVQREQTNALNGIARSAESDTLKPQASDLDDLSDVTEVISVIAKMSAELKQRRREYALKQAECKRHEEEKATLRAANEELLAVNRTLREKGDDLAQRMAELEGEGGIADLREQLRAVKERNARLEPMFKGLREAAKRYKQDDDVLYGTPAG